MQLHKNYELVNIQASGNPTFATGGLRCNLVNCHISRTSKAHGDYVTMSSRVCNSVMRRCDEEIKRPKSRRLGAKAPP
jgi:hypothetical protein